VYEDEKGVDLMALCLPI